jgi:hypothetical protein
MERGIAPFAVAAAVTAVIGALGATGCAADSGDGGILVLKNVRADVDCTSTSLSTETSVPHGSLDLLLPNDYLFIAQMKSRITALDGQEDQKTIITSDAKIDITFPGSTLFSASDLTTLHDSGLTHFKSLFTAPLAPNGGISDGGFTLIPLALVQAIAAKAAATDRIEAVATFTIDGDMSGENITSQPFTYGVTIGTGIGINIAGTCPLPASFGMPRAGYSCNPAQDGGVDCCIQTNGSLLCPAKTATM